MLERVDPNDPESLARLLRERQPNAVADTIKNAVTLCWVMLPKERRTPEILGAEIHGLVESVLNEFNENRDSFDLPF